MIVGGAEENDKIVIEDIFRICREKIDKIRLKANKQELLNRKKATNNIHKLNYELKYGEFNFSIHVYSDLVQLKRKPIVLTPEKIAFSRFIVGYRKHELDKWNTEVDQYNTWIDTVEKSADRICLLCQYVFKEGAIHANEAGSKEFIDLNFCRYCRMVRDETLKFISVSELQKLYCACLRERIRLSIDLKSQSRSKIIKYKSNDEIEVAELVYLFKILSFPIDYRKAGLKSWIELYTKAGVLEELNSKTGIRGYRSIASDGTVCLSMGERIIAEFLIEQDVKYVKEPVYPAHEKLNPVEGLRADFKIGNLWVELAGMMNIGTYAKKIEKKRKLARELGIDLIILEATDSRDLEKLKTRIAKNNLGI
jgi:Pyruvate/2-oxoacid:ferredoxin oxidoreductase delta subunit